jgi:hypothetical protein
MAKVYASEFTGKWKRPAHEQIITLHKWVYGLFRKWWRKTLRRRGREEHSSRGDVIADS